MPPEEFLRRGAGGGIVERDQAAQEAASLAAEAGVIAFKTAYGRWVSEPGEQDLSALIRESIDQLKMLTAGT